MPMKVICKSDYQDVYEIASGVRLIVNKFRYIGHARASTPFAECYGAGCEDDLKTIFRDTYDYYYNKTWKTGQVFYYRKPVELAPKNEWEYKIVNSTLSYVGNFAEVMDTLDTIKKTIEKVVDEA